MKPLLIILSLLLACLAHSQELTVKSLTMEPMDLSASKYARNDLNDRACALVKVQIPLEGMVFEGNVLGNVENKAGEYWVYLTAGSKFFQIKHRSVSPLFIRFADFGLEPLASRTTYVLRLTAPERAMAQDPLKPVAMASKSDPLYPDWWQVTDEGLYVGISPPSYDGKSAKATALLNAMSLYAQSSDQIVQFEAEWDGSVVNEDSIKDAINSRYVMDFTGVSMDVFQEYYNSNGEYFVLCSIRKNPESSDRISMSWEFNGFSDNQISGSIDAKQQMSVLIDGMPITIDGSYRMECNDDTYSMTVTTSGRDFFRISDGMVTGIGGEDGGRFYLSGPSGGCQSRLLHAFPCVPSSVKMMISTWIEDNVRTIKAYFAGRDVNRSKNIRITGSDGEKSYFSITDIFPDVTCPAESVINNSGLSKGYQGLTECSYIMFGLGAHPSGPPEFRKNMSFIYALTNLCETISAQESAITDGSSDQQRTSVANNSADKLESQKIYPLWLLDEGKIDKYNGKKNKNKKAIRDRNEVSESFVIVVAPKE